ncbi:MAG: hypothetical protein MUP09_04215, partial [Thiovulaceae bacterium]|nr:hypothetical protein [Sulfurimonadaceae bacterium]
YKYELRFSEELYAAGSQACIKLLKELDDAYERVMVVGHNPGLEELLERLTGEERRLSTAALAQVELSITRWSEVGESVNGVVAGLWSPRQLS